MLGAAMERICEPPLSRPIKIRRVKRIVSCCPFIKRFVFVFRFFTRLLNVSCMGLHVFHPSPV